jgi:hypothetical protein
VKGIQMTLKAMALASATFACAAMFSPSWSSDQGGLSLSASRAEAQTRIVVRPSYAASSAYYHSDDLPWYPVRAHYHGGPWAGERYSYAGWDDYAKRNGIGCTPGTAIKGGDGIMYRCQ